MCKYNLKIDHKSKNNGNYAKLTKIIVNRGEQRDMRRNIWNYGCKSCLV